MKHLWLLIAAASCVLTLSSMTHLLHAQTPEPSLAESSAPASSDEREKNWPVAMRRFWHEQASHIKLIDGQYWSVKVHQNISTLASAATSFTEAQLLAYLQPGAPNYIRLSDGRTEMTLQDIAKNNDALRVLEGYVFEVNELTIKIKCHQGDSGYDPRTHHVQAVNQQQADAYRKLIPTAEQLRFLDSKSRFGPAAQIVVNKKPTADHQWQAVSFEASPVRPAALHAFCREHEITQLPDFRPVRSTPVTEFDTSFIPLSQEWVKYRGSQYERQDFVWHKHPILIPLTFR